MAVVLADTLVEALPRATADVTPELTPELTQELAQELSSPLALSTADTTSAADTSSGTSLPDLDIFVRPILGSTSMVRGNFLDLYFEVDNIGSVASGAFRTGIYLSTDSIISASDVLLGWLDQPSLSPGYYRPVDINLLGNEGANILNSLGGNDITLGREGNDTINSGAGGDPAGYEVISGGLGADSLTSGGGHDFFNYESITHGGDTITHFATMAGADDDILDFRPMFPTFTNTAGVTSVAQAVVSGHLTYTQIGANMEVYADADGGGNNNVLMATLLNQTAANVQVYTLI